MKELFEYSARLAAQIVENGGEISRAEESVIRICKSAGAKNINVFIIPSMIFASAEFGGERYTAFKRIYKTELNLGALEYANSVSRSICTGESARKINYTYPAWLLYTATMLATGSFCIYFGGSFTDALFSGLIGIIIGLLPVQRLGLNLFSKTLVESTVSGFFAFLPAAFGIPSSPDKIMTGTIMLLIPGMSVGNAMKDMMSGDLIAGILEITEALVTALAIVLGFAAALIVFGRYNYG